MIRGEVHPQHCSQHRISKDKSSKQCKSSNHLSHCSVFPCRSNWSGGGGGGRWGRRGNMFCTPPAWVRVFHMVVSALHVSGRLLSLPSGFNGSHGSLKALFKLYLCAAGRQRVIRTGITILGLLWTGTTDVLVWTVERLWCQAVLADGWTSCQRGWAGCGQRALALLSAAAESSVTLPWGYSPSACEHSNSLLCFVHQLLNLLLCIIFFFIMCKEYSSTIGFFSLFSQWYTEAVSLF